MVAWLLVNIDTIFSRNQYGQGLFFSPGLALKALFPVSKLSSILMAKNILKFTASRTDDVGASQIMRAFRGGLLWYYVQLPNPKPSIFFVILSSIQGAITARSSHVNEVNRLFPGPSIKPWPPFLRVDEGASLSCLRSCGDVSCAVNLKIQ